MLSSKKNNQSNRSKREENLTERADDIFSHRKGTDVLSLMKKFLKPILNPLFTINSAILSHRSSRSSTSKTSSRLHYYS